MSARPGGLFAKTPMGMDGLGFVDGMDGNGIRKVGALLGEGVETV